MLTTTLCTSWERFARASARTESPLLRRAVQADDHEAYDDWLSENGNVEIEAHDILGIKTPVPLGGELVPANLQLENIVDYYRTTGPIYAKGHAGRASS